MKNEFDNEFDEISPEDRELKSLLRASRPPAAPRSLERRVMAAFRVQTAETRPPLWRRFFASSIRIPVPVAATALLLFIGAIGATGWMAMRTTDSPAIAPPAPPAPGMRVVEAPVAQEKIITRTIRGSCVEPVAPKINPLEMPELSRKLTPKPSLQNSADDQIYFTRASVTGFEPVAEMQVRIIKGGQTDEK